MPTPKRKPKAKKNVLELINVPKIDEHWYVKLPDGTVVPYGKAPPDIRDDAPLYKSVTTCTGLVPKEVGFFKWLGNEPSYKLAMEYTHHCAVRGSAVHDAMEHMVLHPGTKLDRATYTDEQWDHLWGMFRGLQSVKPKNIWVENVLHDDDDMTAGMADYFGKVGKEHWMIDYKTSKGIQLSHLVQVQKYGRMAQKMGMTVDKLCIIRSTAKGGAGFEIKIFDFDEKYDDAYAACVLFHKLMYPKAKPKMKEVPTFLSGDLL